MRAAKVDLAADIVAHANTVRKRGPACWTCSLPPDLLASIHEARAHGAEIASISSYMSTKLGYSSREAARLRYHFAGKHHVR